MTPETPNDDCYESVMCCSDSGVSAKGAGAGGNTKGTPVCTIHPPFFLSFFLSFFLPSIRRK
jgi:hypothetical protein